MPDAAGGLNSPVVDPTAVILARMEVKLDNALTEQAKHSTTLDRHDQTLNDHGNRLTAVETQLATDTNHTGRMWSARAVMASAASAGVGVAGLIFAIIQAKG